MPQPMPSMQVAQPPAHYPAQLPSPDPFPNPAYTAELPMIRRIDDRGKAV